MIYYKKIMRLFIILTPILLFFAGCNKKPSNVIIKDLYIETVNFPEDIKSCFTSRFENRMDTSWVINDTVYMYRYKDASLLPDSNLLDNTKKMRISILEKSDSIGNPIFSVEVFKTEESKWRRVSNSSNNPARVDTLLSRDEICNMIAGSTYIYIMKFNP